MPASTKQADSEVDGNHIAALSPPLSSLLHEFLDDRELSVRLGLSPKTPAQWRHLGKFTDELPFYKFGRCVRYRREDVDAFIEKSRVGGIAIAEAE